MSTDLYLLLSGMAFILTIYTPSAGILFMLIQIVFGFYIGATMGRSKK